MPATEERGVREDGLVHSVRLFDFESVKLTSVTGSDIAGDIYEARWPRVTRILQFSDGLVATVMPSAATMALPDEQEVLGCDRKCGLGLRWLCCKASVSRR